jgi:hypothetical protein
MAAGEDGHLVVLPRTDPEGSGLPLNGQSHRSSADLAAPGQVAVGWLRLISRQGARTGPLALC